LHAVQGVVCGLVSSAQHLETVALVCDTLSLRCNAPLWHQRPPWRIMSLMVTDGCKLQVTRCQIPHMERIVGRKIATLEQVEELLEELEDKMLAVGDLGLFDAVVVESPFYTHGDVTGLVQEQLFRCEIRAPDGAMD